MFRKCIDCGESKIIEDFPISKVKNGIPAYRHQCKPCFLIARRSRKRARADWFQEYKKTLKCTHCGLQDHRCLEFHHKERNDKDMPISRAIMNQRPEKAILGEIAKCIVLCANCHRILHYEEREDVKIKYEFHSQVFISKISENKIP